MVSWWSGGSGPAHRTFFFDKILNKKNIFLALTKNTVLFSVTKKKYSWLVGCIYVVKGLGLGCWWHAWLYSLGEGRGGR